MRDHDTADRALLERLIKMAAAVYIIADEAPATDLSNVLMDAHAALARRIAEGARLREAAEEFARYHTLDCGAHFCRYCSARSPEWEHAAHCSYVLSQEAYTKLRAALVAEEPPRLTKPDQKKPWDKMTPAERLRKHASVLFEMPASEQMIAARDAVLMEALTEIANWMEAHEQWTKR